MCRYWKTVWSARTGRFLTPDSLLLPGSRVPKCTYFEIHAVRPGRPLLPLATFNKSPSCYRCGTPNPRLSGAYGLALDLDLDTAANPDFSYAEDASGLNPGEGPMPIQCNAEQVQFSCVERRRVVAAFDGGTVSSDAGVLLRGRADEAIWLIDRLAECFIDQRRAHLIEHTVRTLIGQRVFGIALGYEDLNDQLPYAPQLEPRTTRGGQSRAYRGTRPTGASSSPRCRSTTGRCASCMRISTARAGRWKTASRRRS